MATRSLSRIRVAHSHHLWLPQTMTWLHLQLRMLPSRVDSLILCEATANLEQFDLPGIRSLRDASRWRYYWELGLRRLGVRRHLPFLVREMRRHGTQLLHSHFGYTGWNDLGAVERVGVRHMVTFYGVDVNGYPTADPRWYDRYRILFERVDRVLCEGEYMARSIIELGCPPDKVTVHRLGVDLAAIAYRPRFWSVGEPLRVLMAGTFVEKKGLTYAIDALGRLARRLPLEITLIGDASHHARSRKEKQRILEAIRCNDLTGRIRMLGFQPHSVVMEEAYRHHVYLSPSVRASDGDSEGGAPVAIIEMAASGMPVIATRHCDIPGVVVDGETGFLAEERDVDGLVAAFERLLSMSGGWEALANRARRHVEERFDARAQGARLAELYDEVLDA